MNTGLIDAHALTALNSLASQPAQSAQSLRRLIDQHLEEVRNAAAKDAFVDVDTASAVHEACRTLLNAWSTFGEREQRHIQAACLYFAQTEDGEDDLSSLVGFDDDAEVVNHVLQLINRTEHHIAL